MTATRRTLLLLGALVTAGAPAARAADCSFVSVTGPAFGPYDVFDPGSTDSAGHVAYSCTGGATVVLALSFGNGPTFSPRHLQRAGGFLLAYNLYLDAAHTMIWGDGTGASVTTPAVSPADNAVVMVPIFASIPPHQDVGVGAYTDMITVTMNF